MQGEFDPLAAAWLAGIVRDEQPDLIHYHTSHAVTLGTLGRLTGTRQPAVATRRTSFPTRRNPLFRVKFTFRLDHVIAVSGSIRDDLLAAGVPPESVSVVHSGIDLARFEDAGSGEEFRREFELPPDAFLVGCVGALSQHKGHVHLVRVVAALAADLPALHLALLGEGDLTGEILDEARGLGVGDRVHLAGFRDDVTQATAAFDLSVLPSISGEGSPAAIKEAMAAGVPVVASDIGGVREILTDGREGLIVPPGDEAAMEAAFRRLAGDPDLRRALGEAGRIRAREYSMERMVERTEEVYIRLRGSSRAAPLQG